jgi:hypothetical protein
VNNLFKGQKVTFYDAVRGFWRTGVCYQESKTIIKVKDISGKRFHVPNNASNIELLEAPSDKKHATN